MNSFQILGPEKFLFNLTRDNRATDFWFYRDSLPNSLSFHS